MQHVFEYINQTIVGQEVFPKQSLEQILKYFLRIFRNIFHYLLVSS